MAKKTGIVRDERYLRHSAGFYHPESPERLKAIYAMLDTPEMKGHFVDITPRYATHEEIGLVHKKSYIDLIAKTANMSYYSLDPDTQTSPESYDTAKLAVGGLLNAVDAVLEKRVDNAMALIRPPGHHASEQRAAGFCLFNNVAIAARYLISKCGFQRILIADWDLHHGDGTQAIFYNDNKVLYFSTHQYPAYPGTGRITEIGSGPGLGYTINVPMRARSDDPLFVKAYRDILVPVSLKYKPEFVFISAGFDPYIHDPLGDLRVTPDGFAALTRIIMSIADTCCEGRLVAVLEGGYHIEGVTASVKAVLKELSDMQRFPEEKMEEWEREAEKNRDINVINRVKEQIEPIWHVF